MEELTQEKIKAEIARYEKRLAYLKSVEEDIPGMCDVAYEITECEEIIDCLKQKETFNA